jgi:hypothetical protein
MKRIFCDGCGKDIGTRVQNRTRVIPLRGPSGKTYGYVAMQMSSHDDPGHPLAHVPDVCDACIYWCIQQYFDGCNKGSASHDTAST